MPKQQRPPRRSRRKVRPSLVAPPAARPRVAPLSGAAAGAVEQPALASRPRLPGAMDFGYLRGELRRVAIVCVAMILLLAVLSFIVR